MKGLRNLLWAAPLAIAVGCATPQIHGSMDLSYVPVRLAEEMYENQIRTEIDVNAETEIGKDKLVLGGSQITYMNLVKNLSLNGLFQPTSQDYLAYLKYFTGNFEFYVLHNCNHPINKEFLFIRKEEDNLIGVQSTGETRVGVKIEW